MIAKIKWNKDAIKIINTISFRAANNKCVNLNYYSVFSKVKLIDNNKHDTASGAKRSAQGRENIILKGPGPDLVALLA
jgi:hypothetical protein